MEFGGVAEEFKPARPAAESGRGSIWFELNPAGVNRSHRNQPLLHGTTRDHRPGPTNPSSSLFLSHTVRMKQFLESGE